MHVNDLSRAAAATPIDTSAVDTIHPPNTGEPIGAAGASTGTLSLQGQPATASVSLVAAGPDLPPDIPWSRLPDPLRRVAGFLCLRDRIALARASQAVRASLGMLADATLERARQAGTLSELSAILDRLNVLPDVHHRAAILLELAAGAHCFARPHRLKAWRRVLQACDALPAAARASVLMRLANIPSVARLSAWLAGRGHHGIETGFFLELLERRAPALPAAGRAALTFAVLGAREPERFGSRYVEPPPRVPFDLGGHLLLLSLLPAAQQGAAAELAVRCHARSPGTPDELWREGLAAACALAQPSLSACTLVALVQVITVESEPLIGSLVSPQQAWQQVLDRASKLPPEAATSVAVGLRQCLGGRWATEPFRRQAVDALWQFACAARFDIDQRAAMWCHRGARPAQTQWEAVWNGLLERCATEGPTPSRLASLVRLLDGSPAAAHAESGQRAWWRIAMAAIETALARAETAPPGSAGDSGSGARAANLAGALCAIAAGKWPMLAPQHRQAAFDRLLACIDRLPCAWRARPLSELLGRADVRARAALIMPRLAGMAPLARAGLLALLLPEEEAGEPGPAAMQGFLDALKAITPLSDHGRALLESVLRDVRGQPERHRAGMAVLAADLPTWVGRIDLEEHPALAAELGCFAIVARWWSQRGGDPARSADAPAFQRCADLLTGLVKRLSPERRQAVLLQIGQGPARQPNGFTGLQPSTEWILDVCASLPPAYRVDVLRRWVEVDMGRNFVALANPMARWSDEPSDDQGWAPRHPVWRAIMMLPPQYLAPLLCATADWFDDGFLLPAGFRPRREEGLAVEREQWRDALQRLPEADRVELQALLMPELFVSMEVGVERIQQRILKRL